MVIWLVEIKASHSQAEWLLKALLNTVGLNRTSISNDLTCKILSRVGWGSMGGMDLMEIRLISAQLADTRLTLGCAELDNICLK